MIVNSKIPIQKKVSRLMFLRGMMLFENRWEVDIFNFLQKAYSKAAESMERGDPTPEDAVDDIIEGFTKNSKKWLMDIVWNFAEMAWDDVGAEKSTSKYLVKGVIMDSFYAWASVWGEKRAGLMVSHITNTTRNKIRKVLEKGVMEQKPRPQIAKELIATGKNINRKRANLIARTETHTAAMGGYHEGMNATGLRMEKEWMSAKDSRTRQWHVRAMGQVVPKDDYFIVGPDAMMYPGDETASVKNIANCRCVALYHVV